MKIFSTICLILCLASLAGSAFGASGDVAALRQSSSQVQMPRQFVAGVLADDSMGSGARLAAHYRLPNVRKDKFIGLGLVAGGRQIQAEDASRYNGFEYGLSASFMQQMASNFAVESLVNLGVSDVMPGRSGEADHLFSEALFSSLYLIGQQHKLMIGLGVAMRLNSIGRREFRYQGERISRYGAYPVASIRAGI